AGRGGARDDRSGRWPRVPPHAAGHQRAGTRAALAGTVPEHLAGLPRLVPQRGRRPAARPGDGPVEPRSAHAGADPDLRAAGRADRRRRHGRPDADAVGPAPVLPRLLADGAHLAPAGAVPQLRLRAGCRWRWRTTSRSSTPRARWPPRSSPRGTRRTSPRPPSPPTTGARFRRTPRWRAPCAA